MQVLKFGLNLSRKQVNPLHKDVQKIALFPTLHSIYYNRIDSVCVSMKNAKPRFRSNFALFRSAGFNSIPVAAPDPVALDRKTQNCTFLIIEPDEENIFTNDHTPYGKPKDIANDVKKYAWPDGFDCLCDNPCTGEFNCDNIQPH